MSFRKSLKATFDYFIYTYPFLNRIARNINKLVARFTSFRIRPSGIIKVKFEEGFQFWMETNETSYVTKKLFWGGTSSFEYTKVFIPIASRSSCFLDIGSNIGYYALVAASCNDTISVHAFEPSAGPLSYLQRNTTINGYQERIFVHPLALSNERGKTIFYDVGIEGSQHNFNLSGAGSLKRTHESTRKLIPNEVAVETLDNFMKGKQFDTVDLIKIDVEGAENLILEGASALIEEHNPIIICELLYNTIESEIESIMKSHGYQFFFFQDGVLKPTKTLIRDTDDGVRDCFLVHPSRLEIIDQFVRN